jgi:hypothetical protein
MGDINLDITTNLDIPLTTFALTFEQSGAIADKCSPHLPVINRSAPFPKWNKKSLYHSGSALIGPEGKVEEIKEELLNGQYAVKDFGRQILTPVDQEQELLNLGINKEQRDAKKIMNYLAVEREKRAHTLFMTAANYSGNTAGPLAGTWNLAASTPFQDFAQAIRGIIGQGMRKVAVMGRPVWDALRFNTQVLNAYGRPGGQTMEAISTAARESMARLLEVDEVLVGELQFDSSNLAVATMTREFIWSSKHAAVVVCPKTEDVVGDTLAFALTFRYLRNTIKEIDFGGLPATAIMRRWFDEQVGIAGGWRTVGGYSEDMQIVAPEAGWLITDVIP